MSEYGSLVKRLRRRPLTAETGVRFPYELLKSPVTAGLFLFRMKPKSSGRSDGCKSIFRDCLNIYWKSYIIITGKVEMCKHSCDL